MLMCSGDALKPVLVISVKCSLCILYHNHTACTPPHCVIGSRQHDQFNTPTKGCLQISRVLGFEGPHTRVRLILHTGDYSCKYEHQQQPLQY